MAAAEEETSAWMRRPGVIIAAYHAIIFLHYGLLWVAVAGYAAVVAWRRFSGVVDCSPMLSYSVIRYPITYSYPLGVASGYLVASRRTWPVSKDSKKGINKDPLTLVVVGGVVLVVLISWCL